MSVTFQRDELPHVSFQMTKGNYAASFWSTLPRRVDEYITSEPECVRSWKSDCPVSKRSLAYAHITYWDDNKKIQVGELVMNKDVQVDIAYIFSSLFENRYSIHKMRLIDCYDADDDRSMEDNNTSCFCSRAITDHPGTYSIHSYGRAIDINPLRNPYIRINEDGSRTIYPKNTPQEYIDSPEIQKGDVCELAFRDHGWQWGGDWEGPKQDYQHFDKKMK